MSFAGYLTVPDLTRIHNALVNENLVTTAALDTMAASLLPAFRANNLPINPAPGQQLMMWLQLMNRIHNLRNGDVPLAQFLEVAAILATGTRAADVLDQALQKIQYSGVASPPTIAASTALSASGPASQPPNIAVTLEAQTGAYDLTVSVGFLRDGVIASASVVKLLVHRHIDGHAEYLPSGEPRLVNGTGWIVAPGLVITNHHVVDARRKEGQIEADASDQDFRLQAEHTQVLFDYVTKDAPQALTTGADALVYSAKELDFAILRLPAEAPKRAALKLRSHAIRKTKIQALGFGVNLLQHPNGNPMRLGFRNNYVVIGDDQWLSYLTDTAVGSSGSPVCDDSWKVAALHSGSRSISDQNIVILGQKYLRENYGIPMTTIMSHLQAKKPPLYDEIVAAQT